MKTVSAAPRIAGSFSGFRLRHWTLWWFAASAVLLWATVSAYLHDDRTRTLTDAHTDAINLSRAVAEHLTGTLRVLDQILSHLKRDYERDPAGFDAAAALRDVPLTKELVIQIGVIGPNGSVLASSAGTAATQVWLGDRDYFTVHTAADSGKMHISKPVMGWITERWSIQMTRRLNRPDGSFAGVMTVSLDPEYLQAFLRGLDLGPHGAASVVGPDMIIRAGTPHDGTTGSDIGETLVDPALSAALARAPAGNYEADTWPDAIDRIYSYRVLGDYPLVMLVGLARDDILRDFYTRRRSVLGFATFVSAIFLAAAILLARRIEMQRLADAALFEAKHRGERAEALLRDAVDSMSEGFVIHDAEDRLVLCNEAYRRQFPELHGVMRVGEPYEENLLRLMQAGHYPQAIGCEGAWFEAEMERHRQAEGSSERQLGDGRWVRVTDRRMRHGGIAGLRVDITALKQAQTALREADEHLRLMISSVRDCAIIMLDPGGRVTSWNEGARRLIGYQESEIIGQPSAVFYTLEERLAEVPARQLAKAVNHGGQQAEGWRVRKDGSRFMADVLLSATRDRSGALLGFTKITRDITRRISAEATLRSSEARFRGLLEASPDTILVHDEAGRIILASPRVETLVGYRPEELIGLRVESLMPERHREKHAKQMRRYFLDPRTRGRGTGRTLLALHRDGREFPVEIVLSPYHDPAGTFVITAVRDITERLRIEERLRQAQKMEAIGNLTGGMAHDFNNMLGIIVGNLELLRRLIVDNRTAHELCGEALAGAGRGADLIRRLLAFSRQQPLTPKRTDVNRLVTAMTRLLGRILGESITLTRQLEPEVWPVVVDAVQLEAALLNLATNARDAMPRGGTLRFSTMNVTFDATHARCHPDIPPGDYVEIAVSDSGAGMAPEVIARVFEPFYTTKAPGQGTGLGLSMTFGFVKQSDGHITVASEPGKGTVFRLYVPRGQPGDIEADIAAAAADDPIGGGETVLLVEDNAELRLATRQQLDVLGYQVREAGCAEAALRVLATGGPVDLLFTDVVMPGAMNGLALADEVTLRHHATAVLLTSGFQRVAADEPGSLPPPAYQLLRKPYRHDELARAVRTALDTRKDMATTALDRSRRNGGDDRLARRSGVRSEAS